MMIDGVTSVPFSAVSLPLPEYKESFKAEIIEHSRKVFGKASEEVEKSLQFDEADLDASEKYRRLTLF
jgi:hypothetical protein